MTDSTIPPRAPLTVERIERITRSAADAAAAVAGVHHLGTDVGRAVASVQASALSRRFAPGVRVADRLDGVEVMLQVVAAHPVQVTELARRVLTAVAQALAGIGEPEVIVAVTIADVHGPFDHDEPAPVEDPITPRAAATDRS